MGGRGGGVSKTRTVDPDLGCAKCKDEIQEAWIRVVGLPLHLWSREVLMMIGNSYSGFLAIDKETTLKIDWM